MFYDRQPTYHPQMTQGEAYDKGVRKNQLSGSYGEFQPAHVHSDGERYPTDIIYMKTAESEGAVVHPTQKPVELGRYLIRTYTNPGDVVLDNTCGSGSFWWPLCWKAATSSALRKTRMWRFLKPATWTM